MRTNRLGFLEDCDEGALIKFLTRQALTFGGIKDFYTDLVMTADIPVAFKADFREPTGQAQTDARYTVQKAVVKGRNPHDRNQTIASLLLPLLERVGIEDAVFLVLLFEKYKMLDEQTSEAIRLQYQVPRLFPHKEVGPGETRRGVPIEWDLPGDVTNLQGLFATEPDLLDMGLLRFAIERAMSVCRVEVAASKSQGTGLLIDKELVLTNFHVLNCYPAQFQDVADTVILRFGAFSASEAEPATGQEVKLDRQTPVLAWSSVNELDFILLRTGREVSQLVNVKPAPFTIAWPSPGDAINILQHPDEGPMKLGLAANGVTALKRERGLVRYLTRTSGGSSGAPCFDKAWRVVALHHAEVARPIGTVREGVLLNAIYPQIQSHLSVAPS